MGWGVRGKVGEGMRKFAGLTGDEMGEGGLSWQWEEVRLGKGMWTVEDELGWDGRGKVDLSGRGRVRERE